jgi:hypothetical protein
MSSLRGKVMSKSQRLKNEVLILKGEIWIKVENPSIRSKFLTMDG